MKADYRKEKRAGPLCGGKKGGWEPADHTPEQKPKI
jgi:hypothetical protein